MSAIAVHLSVFAAHELSQVAGCLLLWTKTRERVELKMRELTRAQDTHRFGLRARRRLYI
jgi:hypothetical protein